jgi:hypothetical protein
VGIEHVEDSGLYRLYSSFLLNPPRSHEDRGTTLYGEYARDIMHAHLPGVGIVRGEENQRGGGSPSDADCAVQGVLRGHGDVGSKSSIFPSENNGRVLISHTSACVAFDLFTGDVDSLGRFPPDPLPTGVVCSSVSSERYPPAFRLTARSFRAQTRDLLPNSIILSVGLTPQLR